MKDNSLTGYSSFFDAFNKAFKSNSDVYSTKKSNDDLIRHLTIQLNDLFKDKIKILSIERSPVSSDAIISCLIINSNTIYNLNVEFDLVYKTCKEGNPYLRELIAKIEDSLSLNLKKIEDESFFKLSARPLPKDLMKGLTEIKDEKEKESSINKILESRKLYWKNAGLPAPFINYPVSYYSCAGFAWGFSESPTNWLNDSERNN